MKSLSRYFVIMTTALVVASAITYGAGRYGLERLDSSFEEVASTDLPRLMMITDLRRRIRTMVVLERDHLLEPDAAKAGAIRAEIQTQRTAIGGLFQQYEPLERPERRAQLTALRADVDAWSALDERVLALASAHQTAEAVALSRTHSAAWEGIIKDLIAAADAQLHETTAATQDSFTRSRAILLIVFLGSALLGIVAGFFISRAIRRLVGEIVQLKDRLVAANAGLELTVEARTRQIRAILDHVRFGFFLAGPDLTITDGYTRSLVDLLGTAELSGARVSAALGLAEPRAVDFDAQVGQIFDDILPEELCCDQVPSRILRGDRVLRIQASAVRDAAGQIGHVLFCVSDVTDLEAAERENRDNQTLLRALKNREPFRQFVADLNTRFSSVRAAVIAADEPVARRELHTIKGNASCYGLTAIAEHAHQIEEQPTIALPPVIDLESEFEQFLTTHVEVLGVDRDGAAREVVQIDAVDLATLEARIEQATSLDQLRAALRPQLAALRWRPVRALLGPLDAQVAGLAQRCGKAVTLQVRGGDVSVLPAAVSPVLAVLPHLLRNAVDHGIEAPAARGGKPATATIELGFEDLGASWRVTIADDGRGIDVDALYARALERGLLPPGERPPHAQLCELIFAPRLSTASEVTDISGRGEGMAAVAATVRAQRGSIAVQSERGAGTRMMITLPKPTAPAAAAA